MKPGPLRTTVAVLLTLTAPVWVLPVLLWLVFRDAVDGIEDRFLS